MTDTCKQDRRLWYVMMAFMWPMNSL